MKKYGNKITILIVLGLLIIGGIFIFSRFYTEEYIEETKQVKIKESFIYGQNLNLSGSYELLSEEKAPTNLYLVLNKKEYELEFSLTDNIINFKTNNASNKKRIFLDNISTGKYKLHLKIVTDETSKLYRLTTDYQEEFEYYTVTKNNKNKKLTIKFMNEVIFNVKNEKLPQDYYDIVIDPGHGGVQPGAVYKKIIEKDYTLKISLLVKKQLEALGYKVLLTREKDVKVGAADPYGSDGRMAIPYKAQAKYFFSVHLNSHEQQEYGRGVEIYSPTNVDYQLASELALNIKTFAKSQYSESTQNKVTDGVYVRTFSDEDIEYLNELADENNYERYAISKETQYYFVIRETGGIASKAYRDGRDKEPYNVYYNSKIGSEGYLLELGYIPNSYDYKNIVNNYESYAKGITNGINNYLKNVKN